MLCKKHPKELNVINPHNAGEQLSHRALTHSSSKSEYNALSTKTLLGKAFPSNDLSAWAATLLSWSHSSSLPLPPQPLSTFQSQLQPSLEVIICFGPISDKDWVFLSYFTKLYYVHKALKWLNRRRKCLQITFTGVDAGFRFPAPLLAQTRRCVPQRHDASKQRTE